MYVYLISALLLFTAATPSARAEEPPATPPEKVAESESSAEELPYGAGYEARQRLAEGEGQAREQTQVEERTRTESRVGATQTRPGRRDAERSAAQREARREAREPRMQRGPGGH